MALTPGQIPSPHQEFTDPQTGKVNRTWYRFLDLFGKLAGQLATPITVPANAFFKSGSLNSGGTLEPATMAAGTVLGNSTGTLAAASPQTVDATLQLTGGDLGIAPQEAFSLLGNAGSVVAQPGPITIGAGLTLVPTTPPTLEVTTGGGGGGPGVTDLTAAQLLSWWRQ